MRTRASLVGHGAPLVRPRVSEAFDYEAELAIVIGRRCRHVSDAEALGCVFGYTVLNDGSIRDFQRKTTQWTAGKNFDRSGSAGPWIVTADELAPGAHGLAIRSRLNGQLLQDGNTRDMIFSVPRIVRLISDIMTLEPGDIIATGTPAGVGHARKPPLWMKPGDTIEIEIESIGALRNAIVDEA
jgi:2-keto-4-pentenoate hydratase/2-oxohepta-3-ene-1,7-dioic acid hydratase in catechol pathway